MSFDIKHDVLSILRSTRNFFDRTNLHVDHPLSCSGQEETPSFSSLSRPKFKATTPLHQHFRNFDTWLDISIFGHYFILRQSHRTMAFIVQILCIQDISWWLYIINIIVVIIILLKCWNCMLSCCWIENDII